MVHNSSLISCKSNKLAAQEIGRVHAFDGPAFGIVDVEEPTPELRDHIQCLRLSARRISYSTLLSLIVVFNSSNRTTTKLTSFSFSLLSFTASIPSSMRLEGRSILRLKKDLTLRCIPSSGSENNPTAPTAGFIAAFITRSRNQYQFSLGTRRDLPPLAAPATAPARP